MKHYQLTLEQLLHHYQTNFDNGLTQHEAAKRLERLGLNVIPETAPETLLWVFLRQFKNPLIYILVIAAIIIFSLGNHSDAFFISAIIIFNALVGSIQEGRAQAILTQLKKLATATSLVIRDGKRCIIEDKSLVVGDIIILQEGEKIPADARIIEAHSLSVNESILTGESLPVKKNNQRLLNEHSLFEQKNMVFKGTIITHGSGHALVVATGLATEIGSIAQNIEDINTETPLKKDLDQLSHAIVTGLFGICAILFVIGLIIGKTLVELLVILTALFICAIPEGLPVVFTLVLVTGVRRMAKQHVLVKRLQAAEGLGRSDVIIIDKTGTLTRNEMTVIKVYCQEKEYTVTSNNDNASQGKILYQTEDIMIAYHPELFLLAEGSALLNNAEINYQQNNCIQIKGDPTEAAMGIFAQKVGIMGTELRKKYKKIAEIPFNSELRFHAGFYTNEEKLHIFIAGVPEIINSFCSHSTSMVEGLKKLLADGLRSLALAHISMPLPVDIPTDWQQFLTNNVQQSMHFLGLLGMQDAIRPEVADAVAKARASGLRIVMATGDHTSTATTVARVTGILGYADNVMEGSTFNQLSPHEKIQTIQHTNVFSRVTPQDKLQLVNLFHQLGYVVAMTGDGANDVPSIVAADIGIAMGISGTDITKEAADLILLNDSLSSIVDAIEEGRHILYTLRRVITYFFSTNLGEILIIMIALLARMPLPLLAAQILWLNLVTDGFLDVALAQEPREQGLLRKKWLKKSKQEGLINGQLLLHIILTAVPMAVGSLILFSLYQSDLEKARTITLTSMAMFQWFNAWNCRSETISIMKLNFFSNIWLLRATLLVFVLQVAVVYIPFLQHMFHTVPLTLREWSLIMLVSFSVIIIEELRKKIATRLTIKDNKSSL